MLVVSNRLSAVMAAAAGGIILSTLSQRGGGREKIDPDDGC